MTNKSKPWDTEPTPLTDESSNHVCNIAGNIERRMRSAERLLNATIDGIYPLVPDHDILFDDIKAHIEAAKKEDER